MLTTTLSFLCLKQTLMGEGKNKFTKKGYSESLHDIVHIHVSETLTPQQDFLILLNLDKIHKDILYLFYWHSNNQI